MKKVSGLFKGNMFFVFFEWRVIEKDIVCIDKFLMFFLFFEFFFVVDKLIFNELKKIKDLFKFFNRVFKLGYIVDVVVVVVC